MENFIKNFLKHKILIFLRALIEFEMTVFLLNETIIFFEQVLHFGGQFYLIVDHNILGFRPIDLLGYICSVFINPQIRSRGQ